ncbi:unnamed protein product [Heligmosomoides polygyrus]|uniref:Tail fiber protein n=1 Tax=Heligmosomoides polygyrus TaxID=6339 RepID=A0A183FLA9_HELPZ|nr:unnamed protein product [Heligmosomoides polygyrus]
MERQNFLANVQGRDDVFAAIRDVSRGDFFTTLINAAGGCMDFTGYSNEQRVKVAKLALFFAFNGPLGWASERTSSALGLRGQSLKAWLGVGWPGDNPPVHPNNAQMRELATLAYDTVVARRNTIAEALRTGRVPRARGEDEEAADGRELTAAERTAFENEQTLINRLMAVSPMMRRGSGNPWPANEVALLAWQAANPRRKARE